MDNSETIFLPFFHFQIVFQGEEVSGNIKALKRKDMLQLLPYFSQSTSGDADTSDENNVLIWQKNLQLQDIGATLLPNYITDFQGPSVEGKPAALDVVLTYQYFSALLDTLLAMLIRGYPDKDVPEEKK